MNENTNSAGSIGPSEKDATQLYSKINRIDGIDCWEYTGYLDPNGYGRFRCQGKMCYAHRVAYEIAYGPIPPGMTIDHTCTNRSCIRYEHLEVVTQEENVRRAAERRTHCGNGHEWTEKNTYWHRGNRHCRACNRAAARRYAERKRAAVEAGIQGEADNQRGAA